MLTQGIRKKYIEGVSSRAAITKSASTGCSEDGQILPSIFAVPLGDFIQNPCLHEELFGPSAVAIVCPSTEALLEAANLLAGQLTATIHAAPSEHDLVSHLMNTLRDKAGRLVFNGFPTGVEVGYAMQHGGPYPATTDPRFTSVGPAAMLRFVKPTAYQDFPESCLPVELQSPNPLGIWRTVDGVRTRSGL